jgi:oxygen-independent coproporphyrinogen-3 oxidase
MSTVLADLIPYSRDAVRRLTIETVLQSGLVTRMHGGLGGSHTVVTYPPLDVLEPFDWRALLDAITPVDGLHLYAHIAFCEHLCPFCHYAKTYSPIGEESELSQLYLDALCDEIDSWTERLDGSVLASVYVGGGTPTSISQRRLEQVLAALLRLPKRPDFVACVETSPLALLAPGGLAKHEALLASGVGRLSMGVQTFDDRLLRRTRGHGAREAHAAAAQLMSRCSNVNLDLMQDLPHQTDDALIGDLEAVASLRPQQVTWYILRVQAQSPWHRPFSQGNLELPSAIESVRRRLLIREGMRRLGYTPHPGGRFMLDPRIRDRYKEARSESTAALLGTGVAAYSHGWGRFFRNSHSRPILPGIRGYVERIRRHRCAVDEGLLIDASELMACRLVAGIRSGVSLADVTRGAEVYCLRAQELLWRLERLGLVCIDNRGMWRLTESGFLFEEEVCALFYSASIKNRLVQLATA